MNNKNILVRLPSDETISLLVDLEACTVSDLSEQLELNSNQVLMYGGEMLTDSDSNLIQLGIEENSTLEIVNSQVGGNDGCAESTCGSEKKLNMTGNAIVMNGSREPTGKK